jgi:hypothetical protein
MRPTRAASRGGSRASRRAESPPVWVQRMARNVALDVEWLGIGVIRPSWVNSAQEGYIVSVSPVGHSEPD